MRLLQGEHLLTWINDVRASDLPHPRKFALGLTYDLDAVTAGLILPWSSGQAEGQNTRVKLVKRQGYGRAPTSIYSESGSCSVPERHGRSSPSAHQEPHEFWILSWVSVGSRVLPGMRDDRNSEEILQFLRSLERGQARRGVVRSIERFGVFVDLGGVDGLVSMAELSWTQFDDASEVVRVGQEVVVEVLDVDLERERMTLSLKALQVDPLIEVARTRLGEVVTGPVTKVLPLGVFVEVADGIEGLVHVSEFSDGLLPDEGQDLRVQIADINLRRHRTRLTLA